MGGSRTQRPGSLHWDPNPDCVQHVPVTNHNAVGTFWALSNLKFITRSVREICLMSSYPKATVMTSIIERKDRSLWPFDRDELSKAAPRLLAQTKQPIALREGPSFPDSRPWISAPPLRAGSAIASLYSYIADRNLFPSIACAIRR